MIESSLDEGVGIVSIWAPISISSIVFVIGRFHMFS